MSDSVPWRKQQSGMPQTVNDSPVHGQGPPPPPPPPPSFPGGIAGRRLKTEIPQKILEPPAAIQNAMLTKDKKPFTYTPGGIDLSEIRSPRMARRINRNAQADEMPGIPAPTTNHHVPVDQNGSVNYSAMQSQLPSQVLPPVRTTSSLPPPPPPPPSESAPTQSVYHNRQNHSDLSTSSPQPPKTSPGKPGLPFDPNELFARVNKSPAYEPVTNHHVEPPRNFKNQQPAEDKMNFVGQQRPKSGEIDHNVYVPLKTEPVQSYPTSNASKLRNEPGTSYLVNQPSRNQTAPTTLSSSAKNQENVLPSATPFGNKIQINQPLTQQSMSNHVENKPRVPWATAYKTPQSPQSPQSPLPPQFSVQSSVNRGPESPKAPNTRIIPIQVETENVPKSPGPGTQTHSTSPPSFMQSPQLKQQYAAQQYATQQYSTQQQGAQQYGTQQQYQRNQEVRQQGPSTPEQHSPNVRIIPVEIEGGPVNQNKPAVGVTTQNKFNPMSPTSPTPYSPSYEKDQKPQWASVQSKAFKKEPERLQQQQQQQQQKQPPLQSQSQPVYNSAGVPLSQLRKMQLSEDDRALMDKFKSQVDDETYLHRESDPRYRGGVIPSRAFRILQSMTDTAGDVQQSAPRSPPQTAACNRSFGGTQYYQEPSQGPNVPPSEQQVQEPRKYTGGSIPSRSFRMLQAMTGQEMSGSNNTSDL